MASRKKRVSRRGFSSNDAQRREESKRIIRALKKLSETLKRAEAGRKKWEQTRAKLKQMANSTAAIRKPLASKPAASKTAIPKPVPVNKPIPRAKPLSRATPQKVKVMHSSSPISGYRGTTLPDILRPSFSLRVQRKDTPLPSSSLPPFEKVRHLIYPNPFPWLSREELKQLKSGRLHEKTISEMSDEELIPRVRNPHQSWREWARPFSFRSHDPSASIPTNPKLLRLYERSFQRKSRRVANVLNKIGNKRLFDSVVLEALTPWIEPLKKEDPTSTYWKRQAIVDLQFSLCERIRAYRRLRSFLRHLSSPDPAFVARHRAMLKEQSNDINGLAREINMLK